MQCMKCGREVQGQQVFCPDCLNDMARSPVKPGTQVLLPQRKASEPRVSRKQIRPEEQLAQLRRTVRRLHICVGALTVCLILASSVLAYHLLITDKEPALGQNYSTSSTAVPSGN